MSFFRGVSRVRAGNRRRESKSLLQQIPFGKQRRVQLLQSSPRPFGRLDTSSFSSRSEGPNSPTSLKLYDSLSQSIQDVLPHSGDSDNKGLAFYTCGVTPYAPSHLGHARTYVCLDILRRVLEQNAASLQSPSPLFVMNITDVDDKILAAANESGQAPADLARHFEAEFWRDMDALNCLRPHVVTRVTEYVDSDIVPYIQRLVDLKMAYETDYGVYFDVRTYEDRMQTLSSRYGKLAPPANATDFFTTLEGPKTQKHDVRDFVLWKKRKEGERMYWASPWGAGRPGWHIECSAMIEAVQERFRETHTFQVHAGGVDLKFPHHTNEIAQAEAYHSAEMVPGKEWIPHWVHTGHLHIDGLKMSKSLKNFVTIQDMLSDSTSESSLSSRGDDFRLWCLGLSGSYRGSATYSRERIHEAAAVRQKIVRFLLAGEEWLRKVGDEGNKKWGDKDMRLFESAREASTDSHRALLSDLDGSAYVEHMVRMAELGHTYVLGKSSSTNGPTEPVQSTLNTLRRMLSLVGFSNTTCRAGLDDFANDKASSSSSNVVGGERALLDELVRFRAAVRKAAIAELRETSSAMDTPTTSQAPSAQEIMRLCDDARDRIFPSLGVELMDGKVHHDSDQFSDNGSMWKFCFPHTKEDTGNNENKTATTSIPTTPAATTIDLRSIPLQNLFKVGPYEGQFSEYSDEGMPVRNADGSALSNRLLQKLRTKRAKHAKRLENSKVMTLD